MARQGFMPSVIDRITDPASAGTSFETGYSLKQLEEKLQRDLLNLLNAQRETIEFPEAYRELEDSLVTYGVPDFTSQMVVTPDQQHRLGDSIATAIARFEPRLGDVRVTVI